MPPSVAQQPGTFYPFETSPPAPGGFHPSSDPYSPRRSWQPFVLVAGGVVAIAAIVVGVLLLTRSSSPSTAAQRGGASSSPAAATLPQEGSGGAPPSLAPAAAPASLLPAVPSGQMRRDIQALLYRWHGDIVDGQFRDAWNLLSARRQQLESQERGYRGWVRNQKTLAPYLDPSGIHITIQSLDPAGGVAQVLVTGMRWTAPHASCRHWSGITWVKYEQGEWRYDPGYSTTPQRKHEWKSRFSELLGGSC